MVTEPISAFWLPKSSTNHTHHHFYLIYGFYNAPLQVHYYSRLQHDTVSELTLSLRRYRQLRVKKLPKAAARVGLEPATHRREDTELTTESQHATFHFLSSPMLRFFID